MQIRHGSKMHMLSARNRDEFVAVPQLIRYDYVAGQGGQEPNLLIKGSTLLLKYIILGVRVQLAFATCDRRLLYAMRVFDDDHDGVTLWSIAERQEELDAIRALAQGQPLVSFLFNEIVVNVAWNNLPTPKSCSNLCELVESVSLTPFNYDAIKDKSMTLLDKLSDEHGAREDWLTLEIGERRDWKQISNRFYTSAAQSGLIDLFTKDEGYQQENIGIWLADSLHPFGTYHSPQRPHKKKETRELTDIFLTYEYGAILIESKTFSVFARERLPNRTKLQ